MLRVRTTTAAQLTQTQEEELFAEGFPGFITADHEVKKHIARVRELFTDFDVVLVGEDDGPLATGWGVPVAWSGEVPDLPRSFADCLRRAVELHDDGTDADTLVI